MSAETMTKNNMWESHKGHFNHTRYSCRESDDIDYRDYDQKIHSQKVIPENYDRNDDGK